MNLYLSILKEVNRDRAIREGMLDGRYRERVVINKKKEEFRKYRKNKKIEI